MVAGQRLDLLPCFTSIAAGQEACGLRTGVKCDVGKCEAPDLRERAAKGQGIICPTDHPGKVRIVRRPFIQLALGELDDLPAVPVIIGPPNAGAMPVASPNGPSAALATARDQEHALGPNKYLQISHRRLSSAPNGGEATNGLLALTGNLSGQAVPGPLFSGARALMTGISSENGWPDHMIFTPPQSGD